MATMDNETIGGLSGVGRSVHTDYGSQDESTLWGGVSRRWWATLGLPGLGPCPEHELEHQHSSHTQGHEYVKGSPKTERDELHETACPDLDVTETQETQADASLVRNSADPERAGESDDDFFEKFRSSPDDNMQDPSTRQADPLYEDEYGVTYGEINEEESESRGPIPEEIHDAEPVTETDCQDAKRLTSGYPIMNSPTGLCQNREVTHTEMETFRIAEQQLLKIKQLEAELMSLQKDVDYAARLAEGLKATLDQRNIELTEALTKIERLEEDNTRLETDNARLETEKSDFKNLANEIMAADVNDLEKLGKPYESTPLVELIEDFKQLLLDVSKVEKRTHWTTVHTFEKNHALATAKYAKYATSRRYFGLCTRDPSWVNLLKASKALYDDRQNRIRDLRKKIKSIGVIYTADELSLDTTRAVRTEIDDLERSLKKNQDCRTREFTICFKTSRQVLDDRVNTLEKAGLTFSDIHAHPNCWPGGEELLDIFKQVSKKCALENVTFESVSDAQRDIDAADDCISQNLVYQRACGELREALSNLKEQIPKIASEQLELAYKLARGQMSTPFRPPPSQPQQQQSGHHHRVSVSGFLQQANMIRALRALPSAVEALEVLPKADTERFFEAFALVLLEDSSSLCPSLREKAEVLLKDDYRWAALLQDRKLMCEAISSIEGCLQAPFALTVDVVSDKVCTTTNKVRDSVTRSPSLPKELLDRYRDAVQTVTSKVFHQQSPWELSFGQVTHLTATLTWLDQESAKTRFDSQLKTLQGKLVEHTVVCASSNCSQRINAMIRDMEKYGLSRVQGQPIRWTARAHAQLLALIAIQESNLKFNDMTWSIGEDGRLECTLVVKPADAHGDEELCVTNPQPECCRMYKVSSRIPGFPKITKTSTVYEGHGLYTGVENERAALRITVESYVSSRKVSFDNCDHVFTTGWSAPERTAAVKAPGSIKMYDIAPVSEPTAVVKEVGSAGADGGLEDAETLYQYSQLEEAIDDLITFRFPRATVMSRLTQLLAGKKMKLLYHKMIAKLGGRFAAPDKNPKNDAMFQLGKFVYDMLLSAPTKCDCDNDPLALGLGFNVSTHTVQLIYFELQRRVRPDMAAAMCPLDPANPESPIDLPQVMRRFVSDATNIDADGDVLDLLPQWKMQPEAKRYHTCEEWPLTADGPVLVVEGVTISPGQSTVALVGRGQKRDLWYEDEQLLITPTKETAKVTVVNAAIGLDAQSTETATRCKGDYDDIEVTINLSDDDAASGAFFRQITIGRETSDVQFETVFEPIRAGTYTFRLTGAGLIRESGKGRGSLLLHVVSHLQIPGSPQ